MDLGVEEPTPPPKKEAAAAKRAAPFRSDIKQEFNVETLEEFLLSACLLDGPDVVKAARNAGISRYSFLREDNGLVFDRICGLVERGIEVDVAVLAADMRTDEALMRRVGGYERLVEVSSRVPTTAQASFYIDEVRKAHKKRQAIRIGTRIIEQAKNGAELEDIRQEFETGSGTMIEHRKASAVIESLGDFGLMSYKDPTVLLGNRYLSRGDGMILVAPSGMGKSSLDLQMAMCWALGRDFFGIQPNGHLRSLIIQSEDSRGDIAEIRAGIEAGLKLTDEERRLVSERVGIVTEREKRGAAFIELLDELVAKFQPDLVHLNPLQAFMDGDITQSRDIGAFLRTGLNGANREDKFGYVLVHHTTKPQTGKNKEERAFHELMYDMAGGAELINWARTITSLRPTANRGLYNLNLAKRGTRAGVVELVEGAAMPFERIVDSIPLKHCESKIAGADGLIRQIFWEPRPADPQPEKKGPGRPRKASIEFSRLSRFIPENKEGALSSNELHRYFRKIFVNMTASQAFETLEDWVERGMVERVNRQHGDEGYWRRIP